MNDYTQNVTRGLVRVILALTEEERHSVRLQSVCQYVHCTFSINDHDDHNTTCHVTPGSLTSSDENRKENVY